MNANYFFSQTINGISVGSIYALVALGYTMVYGIVKLINFAHGDIIMVGSYFIMLAMNQMGIPFAPAMIISMVLCAILGVLIEKVAYKPLRNAPRINALITAIGVSIFLQNLFMIIFRADPRNVNINLAYPLEFGGITISFVSLVTIIIAVLMMAALTLFIKYSKMGKAMRAVSEDSDAAALMGINVNNTISITFAIGSALAAVAGGLFSATYSFINPFIGSMFGLKAFIAAVLGGIGIIPGAMLGGFIMGLAESYTKAYAADITGGLITSKFSDTVVFTILIIILVFKPSGILGKNVKEKV